MDEAISDFSHQMDAELKELAKEVAEIIQHSEGKVALEIVFYKILYFVYQRRKYYDVILATGYARTLTRVAETFRPVIEQDWSNYGMEAAEKCFCMFAWELGGVLYYWGTFEQFDFDRIGQHAKALSKLAQNATKRLMDS